MTPTPQQNREQPQVALISVRASIVETGRWYNAWHFNGPGAKCRSTSAHVPDD
jgi:hypothetical protein